MNVVTYTKIEKKLLADWLSLWEKSANANYANAPQWFESALETFHYKEYVIVAIYDNTQLQAIGAFVKQRKYGISVYTVLPTDFVCGIPFLINLEDAEVLAIFIKKLLDLDTVFLNNIPQFGVTALQTHTHNIDVTAQTVNFFMPITKDDTGEIFVPNRKKLLRQIKDSESNFSFKSFDGTSEEGLSIVFAIDKQSRKRQRGYNTFSDGQIQAFYQSLVTHFKKNLLVNILYFEKIPVAYEIGFIAGKIYFGNQIAFIADYSQYSPGKVLLVKLIEHLGAKNIQEIDFGSGDSHTKRMLTNQYRELYQVILSKNKLTRNYMKTICPLKDRIYNKLYQNVKLYSAYRMIKKIFGI
ncbi:MAG TPA: GNAT family N-acetyltransferase [Methylomirabilota bacterium]|nr:GNAT family N-acetyltransferase [Methylomirabilota bacterium]